MFANLRTAVSARDLRSVRKSHLKSTPSEKERKAFSHFDNSEVGASWSFVIIQLANQNFSNDLKMLQTLQNRFSNPNLAPDKILNCGVPCNVRS